MFEIFEKAGMPKGSVNLILGPGGSVDVYKRQPLTLECQVVERSDGPGGVRIVGQVVNMSADEAILGEDGLVDADKAQFLSFDRVRRVYRLLGGVVGQAYHDGRKKME